MPTECFEMSSGKFRSIHMDGLELLPKMRRSNQLNSRAGMRGPPWTPGTQMWSPVRCLLVLVIPYTQG